MSDTVSKTFSTKLSNLNFCSNEQGTPLLKFNLAVLPKIEHFKLRYWRYLCSLHIIPCTLIPNTGYEAELTRPNTSSINILASKPQSDELYYQQVSLCVTFVCVLHHIQNCGGQEGKKNWCDFIFPDLWFGLSRYQCQSLSLRCELDLWKSMYALLAAAQLMRQTGDYTVLQAINVLLAPQALRYRPVSATHLVKARLLALAPVKRGVISLGLLPRFGIRDPANLTQGHTVLSMNKRTGNYENIICHQNSYSWDDFISTHTHSLFLLPGFCSWIWD